MCFLKRFTRSTETYFNSLGTFYNGYINCLTGKLFTLKKNRMRKGCLMFVAVAKSLDKKLGSASLSGCLC